MPYGFTRFSAAPHATTLLLRNHALMRSTSVLSCLDERTACIYIISSDVGAFSLGAGVNLEPHATPADCCHIGDCTMQTSIQSMSASAASVVPYRQTPCSSVGPSTSSWQRLR